MTHSHILARLGAVFYCTAVIAVFGGYWANASEPGNVPALVGYMTDYSASVSLFRHNRPVELSSACVPLMETDVIVLGDDGRATVLFPEGAYVLRDKGTYNVGALGLRRTEEGRERAVEPVLGARGGVSRNANESSIVMPPVDLFASVRPSVMRAIGRLELLSPLGSTLSQTPWLVWMGNPLHDFRVQVVSLQADPGVAAYPSVDITGCDSAWQATGWPPLERGGAYRLYVWRDNVLLTDETHVFRVADEQIYALLAARLQAIGDNLPPGVGQDLAKASLLANPEYGFFAEARLIIVRLLQQEPRNPVYLHLMKHCYAGMGLTQGVAAIERLLTNLE